MYFLYTWCTREWCNRLPIYRDFRVNHVSQYINFPISCYNISSGIALKMARNDEKTEDKIKDAWQVSVMIKTDLSYIRKMNFFRAFHLLHRTPLNYVQQSTVLAKCTTNPHALTVRTYDCMARSIKFFINLHSLQTVQPSHTERDSPALREFVPRPALDTDCPAKKNQ